MSFHLKLEAPGASILEPDIAWPAEGEIKFEDVQMRYHDGLPLGLKGLDLNVLGGDQIRITRTGAGKSSVKSCLFRLIESNQGRILVGDIDIVRVGLHDLWSRLAMESPTKVNYFISPSYPSYC